MKKQLSLLACCLCLNFCYANMHLIPCQPIHMLDENWSEIIKKILHSDMVPIQKLNTYQRNYLICDLYLKRCIDGSKQYHESKEEFANHTYINFASAEIFYHPKHSNSTPRLKKFRRSIEKQFSLKVRWVSALSKTNPNRATFAYILYLAQMGRTFTIDDLRRQNNLYKIPAEEISSIDKRIFSEIVATPTQLALYELELYLKDKEQTDVVMEKLAEVNELSLSFHHHKLTPSEVAVKIQAMLELI